MQFCELGYLYYAQFHVLASTLLLITVLSAFIATYALYQKRCELFQAVRQQRLIPLVQRGRVRYMILVPIIKALAF